MIDTILTVAGATTLTLALLLLAVITITFFVIHVKYYYIEYLLEKGTHTLFKVNIDQYNKYNKGNVLINENGSTYVILKKMILNGKFSLFCKNIN